MFENNLEQLSADGGSSSYYVHGGSYFYRAEKTMLNALPLCCWYVSSNSLRVMATQQGFRGMWDVQGVGLPLALPDDFPWMSRDLNPGLLSPRLRFYALRCTGSPCLKILHWNSKFSLISWIILLKYIDLLAAHWPLRHQFATVTCL